MLTMKKQVQFERNFARHCHRAYSHCSQPRRQSRGGSHVSHAVLKARRCSSTRSVLQTSTKRSCAGCFPPSSSSSPPKLIRRTLLSVPPVSAPRYEERLHAMVTRQVTRDDELENWNFDEKELEISRDFGSGYPGGEDGLGFQ